jgi:hypothetical protein
LIESCPIPIIDQYDERGFSILHHAAIKNIPGKVAEILKLTIIYQKISKQEI